MLFSGVYKYVLAMSERGFEYAGGFKREDINKPVVTSKWCITCVKQRYYCHVYFFAVICNGISVVP